MKKKLLSLALVLAMMFSLATPVFAAPASNTATRDSLENMVREIVNAKIEELFKDDSPIGGIVDDIETVITKQVTDLVRSILGNTDVLGDYASPALSKLLNELINGKLGEYGLDAGIDTSSVVDAVFASDIIGKILDVQIISDILDRTIEYAIDDAVTALLETVVTTPGSTEDNREELIQQYTNEIYNFQIPIVATSAVLGDALGLGVRLGLNGKGGDSVNPFWNIEFYDFDKKIVFIPTRVSDYNVIGWQRNVNAPLDKIPVLGQYATMDTYIAAQLLLNFGRTTIEGGSSFDINSIDIQSIILNAAKRAAKDVVTEYVEALKAQLEAFIRDEIQKLKDKLEDKVDELKDQVKQKIVEEFNKILPDLLDAKDTYEQIKQKVEDYIGFYNSTKDQVDDAIAKLKQLKQTFENLPLGEYKQDALNMLDKLLGKAEARVKALAMAELVKELNDIFGTNLTADMSLEEIYNILEPQINEAAFDNQDILDKIKAIREKTGYADKYTCLDLSKVNELLDKLIACWENRAVSHADVLSRTVMVNFPGFDGVRVYYKDSKHQVIEIGVDFNDTATFVLPEDYTLLAGQDNIFVEWGNSVSGDNIWRMRWSTRIDPIGGIVNVVNVPIATIVVSGVPTDVEDTGNNNVISLKYNNWAFGNSGNGEYKAFATDVEKYTLIVGRTNYNALDGRTQEIVNGATVNVDLSDVFYPITVPAGVSSVRLGAHLSGWFNAGSKFYLVNSGQTTTLTFKYGGQEYTAPYTLDGSDPFKNLIIVNFPGFEGVKVSYLNDRGQDTLLGTGYSNQAFVNLPDGYTLRAGSVNNFNVQWGDSVSGDGNYRMRWSTRIDPVEGGITVVNVPIATVNVTGVPEGQTLSFRDNGWAVSSTGNGTYKMFANGDKYSLFLGRSNYDALANIQDKLIGGAVIDLNLADMYYEITVPAGVNSVRFSPAMNSSEWFGAGKSFWLVKSQQTVDLTFKCGGKDYTVPYTLDGSNPFDGMFIINFPGVEGVSIEHYKGNWSKLSGTFNNYAVFNAPGATSVRPSKGGMTYQVNDLGKVSYPYVIDVPVGTITVTGIGFDCNLSIVGSNWVYQTIPCTAGEKTFNVFGGRTYELQISKAGFDTIKIPEVAYNATVDVSGYFYSITVPESVSNVKMQSRGWIINPAKAGDTINLLKTGKEAQMSFNVGGKTYNYSFILDGSNPFDGLFIVNFPGVEGVTMQKYVGNVWSNASGTFDNYAIFNAPGATSVRPSKGGMTYQVDGLGKVSYPYVIDVPVGTITVSGIGFDCNLSIVGSNWVYQTIPCTASEKTFNVFGGRTYELQISKAGFDTIKISGLAHDADVDVKDYFYTVDVPEGVTGVKMKSSNWITTSATAGDVIKLLKTGKNANVTFTYDGKNESIDFILDGTDPFENF